MSCTYTTPRRSAPLGPAANRLELGRSSGARAYVAKGCGEQVHRMRTKKAGSEEFSEVWMILVTVRDRRRIENLLSLSCAPAVPRPRDSRTSRAEATTAAVVLSDQATSGLSFSVSAATSSAERSETLRDSFNEAAIPPRRTWVLTRSDCSPTTCAPPAVHDSAGKIFNFALGRETYPHAV